MQFWLPVLRSKHSEFVDEGVRSSSGDILIKQLLGDLVIIAEDGREGSEEDTNLEFWKWLISFRHNYSLPASRTSWRTTRSWLPGPRFSAAWRAWSQLLGVSRVPGESLDMVFVYFLLISEALNWPLGILDDLTNRNKNTQTRMAVKAGITGSILCLFYFTLSSPQFPEVI